MGKTSFSNSNIHIFDIVEDSPFCPVEADISLDIDPPKFSVPRLASSRAKIQRALREIDVPETKITPRVCEEISKQICLAVSYPISRFKVLYDSLYPEYIGKPLDESTKYLIATKISGNLDIIKENKVIPLWENINLPIWAPVEIIKQEIFYTTFPCLEIQAFVTAGVAAGLFIRQRISRKFAKHMLRETGYPRFKPFTSEEIFNTKFTSNLMKIRGRTKMVAFSSSSSQEKHNKQLYKIRHACPLKLPVECRNCLNGLDRCPGAVHAETYTIQDCDGHRGIFSKRYAVCLKCVEREKMKRAMEMLERKKI